VQNGNGRCRFGSGSYMNDDIEKSNSLTDLAARIRASHEAGQAVLRSAVKYFMNTGDMLLEAKEQLPHGKW
jgi:hypothetical protein